MITTTNVTSQKLVLPFLGERIYFQGATLFEVLEKQYPEAKDITFKINSMILTNHILLFDLQEKNTSSTVATFVCTQDNSFYKIGVLPLEAILPIERIPYDESKILTNVHFDQEKAFLNKMLDFSFIKTIVSINKELVGRTLADKTRSQILFTRIDLNYIPKIFTSLEVHLQMKKQTANFFISKIIVDGTHIGELYFSVVEKNNG